MKTALNEQLPNYEPAERTAGKVTKNAKYLECQMRGAYSKRCGNAGEAEPLPSSRGRTEGARPCFSMKGGWRDSKGTRKESEIIHKLLPHNSWHTYLISTKMFFLGICLFGTLLFSAANTSLPSSSPPLDPLHSPE